MSNKDGMHTTRRKSFKTKKRSPEVETADYRLQSAVVRGEPKEVIDALREKLKQIEKAKS